MGRGKWSPAAVSTVGSSGLAHTLYKVVVVLAINQVVNLVDFDLGAVEKTAKAVCLFAEEEAGWVSKGGQQR